MNETQRNRQQPCDDHEFEQMGGASGMSGAGPGLILFAAIIVFALWKLGVFAHA